MTQHDRAPAEPNTWAVHFPGNLRWTNAMQIVKGMAPYRGGGVGGGGDAVGHRRRKAPCP